MKPAKTALAPGAAPAPAPAPAATTTDVMSDVVAAGSLLLSGVGWQKIHSGHLKWQATLSAALTHASERTHMAVGSLTKKGVFDTLLAIHYLLPAQVDQLEEPVRALVELHCQRVAREK